MDEKEGLGKRIRHAWNAFNNREESIFGYTPEFGAAYSTRPDRVRSRTSGERSIIASIYTRLSIDVAKVVIRHVRQDQDERYTGDIVSGLNNCLKVEANIDQAARHFRQDIALSLFEEGTIAIVPVETSANPTSTGSFDILQLRIGKIVQWYPRHVKVDLYNDQTGRREQITLEKKNVAIVENPLYAVMNEPNSTLQRLMRKLSLLDYIDEQSSSGKLDMIIQLPYTIKSDQRRAQAEQRRRDIEFQLKGSKYGIAYTDGTEKITQLNRPTENTLREEVDKLFELLYTELGLTPDVMKGTATEAAMLNYMDRTIEPIVAAVTEAMTRAFLTKTARTQGQTVDYFLDLFKLVPMSVLAEIADKFTRNEIATANEFRTFLGMKPSNDPKADMLRNSNMPLKDTELAGEIAPAEVGDPIGTSESEAALDELDRAINQIFDELGADIGGS